MWIDLLSALALLLVIEGIFPFLNPAAMRKTLVTVTELDDATLRIFGLVSMVAGAVLLYIVR